MRRAAGLLLVAGLLAGAYVRLGPGGDGSVAPPDVLLGTSSPYRPDRNLERRVRTFEDELLGRPLDAVRLYHRWDEPFPAITEEFLRDRGTLPVLSISTERTDGTWVPWSDLATGRPGSASRRELEAWAAAIGRWEGPLVVTLDHEPDHYRNGGRGRPQDYVRAFRRFAEAAEAAAGDELRVAWIATAEGFRAGDGGGGVAPATAYYPGDEFVDLLGADGFNWAACRQPVAPWRSFAQVFDGFLVWAEQHPRPGLLVAEVGTVEDAADAGRKAAWLREAAEAVGRPEWDRLEQLLFWDSVHETHHGCDFRLRTSPSSAGAYAAIAARATFLPGSGI